MTFYIGQTLVRYQTLIFSRKLPRESPVSVLPQVPTLMATKKANFMTVLSQENLISLHLLEVIQTRGNSENLKERNTR
jgi:hypothetical protein